MLDRKDVKEGYNYLLNGEEVTVFMIHKPSRGESVTLYTPMPDGWEDPIPYLHKGTMQMRKFQKAAIKMPEVQG